MSITRGPTLAEQVYSLVRERIVNGDLQPGAAVVESELASELEVSRTPVSNALIMLKERGLLEEAGGRATVPRLTLQHVLDLYLCRLALDGVAARCAAAAIGARDLAALERNLEVWEGHLPEDDRSALWVADLRFHETIYRVCGNPHLSRFAQIAGELVAVYRRRTLRRLGDGAAEGAAGRTREDVRREHRAIYRALERRDPGAAERAARDHIENVMRHLENSEVIEPEPR